MKTHITFPNQNKLSQSNLLVDSRFFLTLLVILVSFLLRYFTMSQHSSSFPPNLLKTLEADIYKFKLFGPPVFRLNVQCKHKEHCKYGKYSCQYSHESFCKFQRNGRKCQNNSCTHQHELPLEYQLARALFTKETQFSSDLSSFEAQKSTSESHFQAILCQTAARPKMQFFASK